VCTSEEFCGFFLNGNTLVLNDALPCRVNKNTLVLESKIFFFFPACFSDWSKDICHFERCVCISIAFFPLLTDDVVISLGLCLYSYVQSVLEESPPEKEKKNKHVQAYGKLGLGTVLLQGF